MRTRFLLFMALLLAQPALRAQQWFRYKDFPVNVTPKDITANSAGTLFMLTKNNMIFYKPQDGNWTEIPGLLPDGSQWPAPAIAVDKRSNRLYIANDGYPGGLSASSDLGATWSTFFMQTSPVSGLHEAYLCFTEINDPNLFFAGTLGGVIKLTNQGTSGHITLFGSPFTSTPEAVHYTRNRKLLAGTFNDGIWISTNDAATITRTNFVTDQVYRFTEDGNGRVYALTKNLTTLATRLIFSDNYMDWNTANLPNNTEEYTTLYFDSATANLWLGSQSGLYKTPVNTITWQSANLNNGGHSVVEVIGDYKGGLYNFNRQHTAQKRNSGATAWEEINGGLTGKLDHIVFNSNNKLFGFEQYYSEQVSSLDPPSGTPPTAGSWQNSPPSSSLKNTMNILTDPSNPNIIYYNAITSANGDQLYRSENAGLSYTEVSIPPGFSTQSSYISTLITGEQNGLFALGTDALSVGLESKLFASFDKGDTWSQLFDFGSRVDAVAQDAQGHMYALVTIDTTFNINLYHSSDTGQSWNLLIEDVLPFTRSTLFAKGPRTFLYNERELYTIDPAASSPLTAINLPWPPTDFSKTLNTFQVSQSGSLFIYANDLYTSADTGLTWTNKGHPGVVSGENQAYSLQIAFDSIPFIIPWPVAANDRGIYYCRSTPMLSIRNISKEHNLVVFPNPAANTLQVKTDYRGDISLINVLGQQLNRYRIKREETEIDMTGLAAGIYFIRLEETGQSIKIIKQ